MFVSAHRVSVETVGLTQGPTQVCHALLKSCLGFPMELKPLKGKDCSCPFALMFSKVCSQVKSMLILIEAAVRGNNR